MRSRDIGGLRAAAARSVDAVPVGVLLVAAVTTGWLWLRPRAPNGGGGGGDASGQRVEARPPSGSVRVTLYIAFGCRECDSVSSVVEKIVDHNPSISLEYRVVGLDSLGLAAANAVECASIEDLGGPFVRHVRATWPTWDALVTARAVGVRNEADFHACVGNRRFQRLLSQPPPTRGSEVLSLPVVTINGTRVNEPVEVALRAVGR